jgi:hypothetical protein
MHDAEMRAWQHDQAISPASRWIRQKVRGRTKAEVREKLQALHRELEAGLRVSATYTVASCIRDWLDDGPATRQARTVENYRRLADHAIGKLGAVKLKDLTARLALASSISAWRPQPSGGQARGRLMTTA